MSEKIIEPVALQDTPATIKLLMAEGLTEKQAHEHIAEYNTRLKETRT